MLAVNGAAQDTVNATEETGKRLQGFLAATRTLLNAPTVSRPSWIRITCNNFAGLLTLAIRHFGVHWSVLSCFHVRRHLHKFDGEKETETWAGLHILQCYTLCNNNNNNNTCFCFL